MNENDDKIRLFQHRFKLLYFVIFLWFIIYIARLWQLQILNGAELKDFSERNLIKESRVAAPRGLIFDKDGQILVENLPGFEITISPQYTEDLTKTATTVSKIVDIPVKEIITKVKKSRRQNGSFYPVSIKENLSRDEVFRLKQLRLDHAGLDIREIINRTYPLKENGAHLLGYVGEISKKELPKRNKDSSYLYRQGDIVGIDGIEKQFEKYIRGIPGISFTQVDARGRETANQSLTILGQKVKDEAAIPGNNIYLTVDRDIQEAAFKSFQDLDRIGAIVAVRPTGEVLAWVSRPAFDPNIFSRRITPKFWKQLIEDPFKPLGNKVIQEHQSPGSTFKAFVAAAALEENLIDPDERKVTPGSIRIGRRTYHDHVRGGHGNINLYEALERSSNVYFYRLGIELTIDKIFGYTKLFGLGKKTGIELRNEIRGLLPNAKWKLQETGEPWQKGEDAVTSIGQGFVLTTPLQMAMSYAAIGAEGKLYKPYVVKKVVSHEDEIVFEQAPVLIRDLTQADEDGFKITTETHQKVKKGLWMVSNGKRGTARGYKIPGVEISGKSGTTQVMSFSAEKLFEECEDRPRHQRHHGWFVGYAPPENPEIVVSVLAEHSCGGTKGGAPVVRDVIKAYFEKYHPEVLEEGKKRQREKWRAARKRRLALKKEQERQDQQQQENSP